MIIEPRMVEDYCGVAAELRSLGGQVSLGWALFSPGGSLLHGSVELASHVIGLPVRLGTPRGFGGFDRFRFHAQTMGVGLVLHRVRGDATGPVQGTDLRAGDTLKDIFQRMTRWVSRYF